MENELPPAHTPDFPPPPYVPCGISENIPPPAYEFSVTDVSSVVSEQLPPSYESLYGQIRAAREDASGTFEFFKKFTVIVLSTVGFTFFVGLLIAVPVSMIVIGSIYFDSCPRQPYIPVYLIVGGCVGVLKTAITIGQRIRNRVEHRDSDSVHANPLDGTLSCFIFCWFIAGNVWIYSITNDYDSDPSSENYCNEVLYQYAFWLTTGLYILVLSTWFIFCVVGTICASVRPSTSSSS